MRTEERLVAFQEWLVSPEATQLIGGEHRNHVDTAHAAFQAGWEAAEERRVFADDLPRVETQPKRE